MDTSISGSEKEQDGSPLLQSGRNGGIVPPPTAASAATTATPKVSNSSTKPNIKMTASSNITSNNKRTSSTRSSHLRRDSLQEEIYKNIYEGGPSDRWKGFGSSWGLMVRWKGSVYQLIWHELIWVIGIYYTIAVMYRHILIPYYPTAKENFELFCAFCKKFDSPVPVTFLTGFYVSNVACRWWDQFMSLPFPDQIALKMVAFVPGTGEYCTNLRRTVMRYVNLSNILVLRQISSRVEKRFPTYKSLQESQLLMKHELARISKVNNRSPHESSWAPLLWAMKLLSQARDEGKIHMEPPVYSNLQNAFDELERNNRKLLNFSWVNFPLAYTQIATVIATAYFSINIFARQFLQPPTDSLRGEDDLAQFMFGNATIEYSSVTPFDTPNIYIPFFYFVEFTCMFGWLKVAETMLNPFGEDDADFDCNYLIDRNLSISYLIVDEAEEDLDIQPDPFLGGLPMTSSQQSNNQLPSSPDAIFTEP